MQDLNITLVQTDLFWEDKARNLEKLEAMLAADPQPTDLIVLPEMFATGFSMQTDKNWSSLDGTEVKWMQQLAKTNQCHVAGSLNIRENGQFYNRLLVVNAQGVVGQYDKRHLFGMAGEDEHYTAGQTRFIYTIAGWRIHFLICYDLRFPVWARNQNDYDLLVYVANWPARRAYAWQQLLIARAIENQSYVAGVNRVGTDGNGLPYRGDSALIDPMGEVLWTMAEQEAVLHATISAKNLQEVRNNLPFLRDRDNFKLES